jgi:capsid protein
MEVISPILVIYGLVLLALVLRENKTMADIDTLTTDLAALKDSFDKFKADVSAKLGAIVQAPDLTAAIAAAESLKAEVDAADAAL